MQQGFVLLIPPWAAMSAVLGGMHGALFHLVFGHGVRQLLAQLVIGAGASTVGGLAGTIIPSAGLAVGDTNLIVTAIFAWAALGIARLFRLC
ncbi:MAG: hypothetical protein GEU73_08685 [Chloroflexi bacterium]|nr:hypothetical protein [Chloroflexota bacterium]